MKVMSLRDINAGNKHIEIPETYKSLYDVHRFSLSDRVFYYASQLSTREKRKTLILCRFKTEEGRRF